MSKASRLVTRAGLPAAALALAAAGAASGPGGSASAHAVDAPLRCEIAVSETRHGTTYAGRVEAVRAVKGSYAFSLVQRSAGGQSVVNQGGAFDLRPGQVEVLGEASFGGRASRVDAELTLKVNGRTLHCALDDSI